MADTAAVLADHELILAERHAEISARLGIPIGSIGPSRMRALVRLSRDPEILALR